VRAIWTNDIHLEFLEEQPLQQFLDVLANAGADAILIGGDIAQAPTVTSYLQRIEGRVGAPVYFVLGNHDYYRGSIEQVQHDVGKLHEESEPLFWLSRAGVVQLAPDTCLIGHDGWGDARLGDAQGSNVMLNDFLLIRELSNLPRAVLIEKLNALGDQAAAHIAVLLPKALEAATHVVVLTHVPPFLEAAWYNGKPSKPDWAPFFTCKALGDVLRETMAEQPGKKMTVLCGHTHGQGRVEILPNLEVLTGGAHYGRPCVQEIFNWE